MSDPLLLWGIGCYVFMLVRLPFNSTALQALTCSASCFSTAGVLYLAPKLSQLDDRSIRFWQENYRALGIVWYLLLVGSIVWLCRRLARIWQSRNNRQEELLPVIHLAAPDRPYDWHMEPAIDLAEPTA